MQEKFNFFYKNHHFYTKIACLWYVYAVICLYFCSVRLTGLEPARRETLDPKSSASTNSATGAFFDMRVQRYE